MKKHIRLLTLAAISLAGFTYGNQLQASSPDNAIFSHFTYTGQDKVYNDNKLSANEFYSPILQGCYPDPSICRKGNDYYLACSSFAVYPGVPIFHSTDLVNLISATL